MAVSFSGRQRMAIGDRLAHRVALVTGGGGEIGGAICRRFAAEGAEVAIADLDPAKPKQRPAPSSPAAAAHRRSDVDVADEASAKGRSSEPSRHLGGSPRWSMSPRPSRPMARSRRFRSTTGTGHRGQSHRRVCDVQICCAGVRRAGGGSIINIASQLGHLGVPLRSPYCTTKAALIHFTRILAMDHAVDKIRANTISPGFILTERSSRRSGGKAQARAAAGPRHLPNRPGEPEEIAAGAAYLASDDAAFVTATDLLIDGGYVAFKGRIDTDGRPAMI